MNPAAHNMKFESLDETEIIQKFFKDLQSSAVNCEFLLPECQHKNYWVKIKSQFIHALFNEQSKSNLPHRPEDLNNIRPVIKDKTACDFAAPQNNILLVWHVISMKFNVG